MPASFVNSELPPPSGETPWTVTALTRHIEEMHHRQERLALHNLCQLIQPLVKASACEEVSSTARRLLYDLKEHLELHMLKAEHVLFPKFRNLEAGSALTDGQIAALERAEHIMRNEQSYCLALAAKLEELFNDYMPKSQPDEPFEDFMLALKSFHADLVLHCLKEHDLLMPLVKRRK